MNALALFAFPILVLIVLLYAEVIARLFFGISIWDGKER